MDSAVITGLFTLGGVVVGGVLNQALNHHLERRRAGWEAKKAARLFAPSLHRLHIAGEHGRTHAVTWDEMADLAKHELVGWETHADVFAGTIEWDDWFEIYSAVRVWQQIAEDPPRNEHGGLIRPGTPDAKRLAEITEKALDGALQCGSIGVNGIAKRRFRRTAAKLRDRLPGKERREKRFESLIRKDFEERFGFPLDS
ncbi:MAG TPA: hypothetical protein VHF88_06305 [Thermoleophilaceae bacterium]|nr:hypothetical protein [Thermoleophilaceae bacterium]